MNINETESAQFRAGRAAALAEAGERAAANQQRIAQQIDQLRRGFLRRAALAVGVAVFAGLAAGYFIGRL